MLKFLQRIFRPDPLIIETSTPRKLAALDSYSRESVLALRSHPGFMYLLAKLRFEKSVIETQLKKGKHSSVSAVEALQAGIYWSDWLEDQLAKEVGIVNRPKPAPLSPDELSAYKATFAAIEEVG